MLRGELDRQEWKIYVCATEETLGVIFPTDVMAWYLEREKALAIAPSDPVFVELMVTPVPTSLNSPDAVGVLKVNRIDRGSCGRGDEALGDTP